MGSYQSNTSNVIKGTSAWVEFEDDWFAQGPSRLVYRGTFRDDSRREGKRCVVKVYKQEWYEDREARNVDYRAYRKAYDIAQSFNNEFNTSRIIEFIKPEFAWVNTLAAFNFLWCIPFPREVKGKLEGTRDSVSNVIPKNATLAVERYLEGDFIKFSSNTGYVHPDSGSSSSAFSHYSYHITNGEILICGLQGVRSSTEYRFTSPAIHSGGTEFGVYGPTDLGKFGIVKFFTNHTCHALCTGLSKPKLITNSLSVDRLVNKIVSAMNDNDCSSMYTHKLCKSTGVSRYDMQEAQKNLRLALILDQRDTK